ncbi:CpaF family protein [Rhizobium sp. L1K21]|uniref:CpaF family protein n=1 Tax=Rhizobium sp. L1K21 TaxID=2954933 RepID=UPI00209212A8|nr:ATPase, T2SS/T4P/T4SS family [Rhizobium sp. L1K21]MCO6188236.1 Flp pilus assembly complex ATPase component TadA [Rhizobium sp. L1K21]
MNGSALLEIRYTSERPTQIVPLEAREYRVGAMFTELSHERGEIPLSGTGISRVQFRLIFDVALEQWLMEPVGTTETFLGEKRVNGLAAGRLLEIPPEAHIMVPGARIMVRPMARQTLSDSRYDEWVGLQDNIYDKLFGELALEPGETGQEHDSPENRASMAQLLDKHASIFVNKAADKVIRSANAAALRLTILKSIAGTSSSLSAHGGSDGPQRPGQVPALAKLFGTELRLALKRESVAEDVRKLEEGFQALFTQIYENMPIGDKRAIAKWFLASNVWNAIFNFGPITDLMDLEIITEVMVVRHDRIYVERFDRLERYDYGFSSPEQLLVIVKRLANRANREVNQSSAMVDFKLNDGSRVNAIIAPLSRNGPCITIRKHRKSIALTLDILSGPDGSMNRNMAGFLKACVLARKNIIVSGGTGTGKTTLLNAMSAFVPNGQRVITIEDTAELALANEHVVSLETRTANAEGGGQVTIRDLLRNSLRMRPDRIIVGECRGGEAVDMLQALNTGHAGSMTTAHANGADEMLMRLEVMVLQGEPNLPVPAIRRQIANAIDIIVQLTRMPLPDQPGRSIKLLTSISEVIGIHPLTGEIMIEPIFEFAGFSPTSKPVFLFTGYLPSFIEEIDEVVAAQSLAEEKWQLMEIEYMFQTEIAA